LPFWFFGVRVPLLRWLYPVVMLVAALPITPQGGYARSDRGRLCSLRAGRPRPTARRRGSCDRELGLR
jgi:hypothetical protein